MKFVAGQPATVMKSVPGKTWRDPQKREPVRTVVVKRVMKRWLEADDGSKWYLNGTRYPKARRRFLETESLEPGSTADIERRAKANQAREWISRCDRWTDVRDLSDDAALDIAERWQRDRAEHEKHP